MFQQSKRVEKRVLIERDHFTFTRAVSVPKHSKLIGFRLRNLLTANKTNKFSVHPSADASARSKDRISGFYIPASRKKRVVRVLYTSSVSQCVSYFIQSIYVSYYISVKDFLGMNGNGNLYFYQYLPQKFIRFIYVIAFI